MSDLALHVLITIGTVALAAGGLLVKVSRLERDVEGRVSKELFDLHAKTVERELAEIKGLLMARGRYGGGDVTGEQGTVRPARKDG